MSWDSTYTYTVAISVDVLTASVFWNKKDLTVSSLCGLELRKKAAGQGAIGSLVLLGRLLNKLNAGHCEAAIRGDRDAALNALASLGVKVQIVSTEPAP